MPLPWISQPLVIHLKNSSLYPPFFRESWGMSILKISSRSRWVYNDSSAKHSHTHIQTHTHANSDTLTQTDMYAHTKNNDHNTIHITVNNSQIFNDKAYWKS